MGKFRAKNPEEVECRKEVVLSLSLSPIEKLPICLSEQIVHLKKQTNIKWNDYASFIYISSNSIVLQCFWIFFFYIWFKENIKSRNIIPTYNEYHDYWYEILYDVKKKFSLSLQKSL